MSKFQIVFEAVTGPLERGLRQSGTVADQTTAKLKKTERATLDVREASLKVETAQQRAARATARYGQESLQAQQASVKLERAQERLSATTTRHSKSTGILAGNLGTLVKRAGGVAAAYASIAGAKDAVNVTTELGETTLRLHRSFGLATKSASEWAAVAASRGTDGKALTMGFKALATATRNATSGSKAQLAAFKDLGIGQQDLAKHGDDLQWVLKNVSDGLKDLPDGTNKAAIQAKLFGRTWTTISPLIRDGSAAMADQMALADKYGATLGGKTVEDVHKMIAAQRQQKLAMLGVQVQLGQALLPALTAAAGGVAKFVAEMRSGEGTGGRVAAVLKSVASTVGNLGATVGPVVAHVASLGAAFLTSHAGAVALSAIIGGLAGRFAGLGIAAVVTQVAGLATAARAAGGTMAGLSLAIKSNPIGLVATAVGVLAGAYIGMSASQRQATTSSHDLTDALNTQRDAARQLADFDLEAQQRKANLKSANAQLTQSEHDLGAARKSGNADRIKQSEAGLEQARINVKRATRDVNRTEDDRKRLVNDSADADRKATDAARGRIHTLEDQISDLKRLRQWAEDKGASDDKLAAIDDKLAGKQRQLNRELNRLPTDVRTKVTVETTFLGVDFGKWKAMFDGLKNTQKKRAGGRVAAGALAFAAGGMVPAMVSPGELLAYGNSAAVVPGSRTASDSVFTMLPAGTEVYTDHGQSLLASGASRAEALAMQAPHFATGGVVRAAQAARKAGLTPRRAVLATAVAGPESDYDVRKHYVTSREDSRGPWQINVRAHPWAAKQNLYDWDTSAQAMARVSSGGRHWEAWSGYTSGKWRKYLDGARAAVSRVVGRRLAEDEVGQDDGSRGRLVLGQRYTDSARTAGVEAGLGGASRISGDLLGQIIAGAIGNRDAAAKSSPTPVGSATEGTGGFGKYGLDTSQATKARRMLSTATSIAGQHLPYQYGGFGNPSYDCSGYVSKVLDGGGIGGGRMTVARGTGLYTFGASGPGKYATWGVRGSSGKNAHTMVRLGNRYFESGGGHGPAEVRGWNGSFAFRHVPGFAKGGTAGGAPSTSSLLSAATAPAADEAGVITRAFDALAVRLADSQRVTTQALSRIIDRAIGRANSARKDGDAAAARRQDAIANVARAEQGRRLAAPIVHAQTVGASVAANDTKLSQILRIRGVDPSSAQGLLTSIGQGGDDLARFSGERGKLTKALARARKLNNGKAIEEITKSIEDLDATILDRQASLAEMNRQLPRQQAAERIGKFTSQLGGIALDEQSAAFTIGGADDRAVAGRKLGVLKGEEAEVLRDLADAMGRGDGDAVNELTQTLIGVRGDIHTLSDALRYSAADEKISHGEAALIQAQVDTPGDTTDDKKALQDELDAARQAYEDAKAAGDDEGIKKYGQAILSLTSSIDALAQVVDTASQQQQALADALTAYAANQQKLIALAQAEPSSMIAALVAAMNGGIGETVGVASGTPLFSGSFGARW